MSACTHRHTQVHTSRIKCQPGWYNCFLLIIASQKVIREMAKYVVPLIVEFLESISMIESQRQSGQSRHAKLEGPPQKMLSRKGKEKNKKG